MRLHPSTDKTGTHTTRIAARRAPTASHSEVKLAAAAAGTLRFRRARMAVSGSRIRLRTGDDSFQLRRRQGALWGRMG